MGQRPAPKTSRTGAAPGRAVLGCCRLIQWRTPIKKGVVKRSDRTLLNEEIRSSSVRLIGPDGNQVGVVSRGEALESARRAGLDLVMISPDAEPPVVKVMDFGKHLFELKKVKAAQKKKQKQIQIKEIKFRPGTEEGDYQVKLRNLVRFLEEGDKAKISLRFRGREVVHPEIGMQLMSRVSKDLEPYGTVEAEPKFEGRQVVMVLAPKKKKKAEKATGSE
ncbi:MAG: translation initiation factor IF-3 [Pseudomonadales bacterium]|nr:translation initiation factor IF-3 [Pseudomonadales bacterium]